MASIKISRPLLALPEDWVVESNFVAKGSLSGVVDRKIEPIGPHFLAHARRKRHSRTFSEDDRIQAQQRVKNVEDEDAGEISEPEDPMLLSRDPKDWKNQDHYAVLGLSKYRWRATDEQIKKAHRKKVLKHHPDKKAAAGAIDDDNFFKCIQKAMEILTDPIKRRQFDSVDENADVDPPSKKAKGNFYKQWGPVFAAEGRFSRKQPVPKLGNESSTKEEVDAFYNFFYNFDSWRTFEYLDEDVPDDNENRDQKRHVERKNKASRARKKTEDTARLRKLVDTALNLDSRIKKFKEEERKQRNAKRDAREAEEKRLAEEARIKAEEDKKRKEEEEAAAKANKIDSKKAKEAAKQALKKNRRVLKSSVKDVNYFADGDATPEIIDNVLSDVELIQCKIDNEELNTLARKLEAEKGKDAVKATYLALVGELINKGAIKASDLKFLTPA
ncbi:Zuotin [Rhizina undulata]